MIKMLLPIALVIFSNVFYNLSAKFTPSQANSFLSVTVTYITAAVLSFGAFCITGSPRNLVEELSKLNWSAFVLGISIIGIELGYIYIYRAGWKMGIGPLIANITLACVLLVIGFLVFKETVSFRQLLGIIVCAAGLIMITK